MSDKYVLFSLEDEKAKKLGNVISNATARKIVNFLAEQEASESEISKALGFALNTVEYNLKKLLETGIIEKSKKFFWSKKGKKIDVYKVANKLIVISPKKTNVYSKLKSVVPVILVSVILTYFIFWYSGVGIVQEGFEKAVELPEAPVLGIEDAVTAASSQPIWLWFFIGALIAVIVFMIWNWRKL